MTDLPITVPISLHDAIAQACGEDFAASYLCGAELKGTTIRPRTDYASDMLKRSDAARVLGELGIGIGIAQRPDERVPIPAVEQWREDHPNHVWTKRKASF